MLPVGGAAPRTFVSGGKNPRAATGSMLPQPTYVRAPSPRLQILTTSTHFHCPHQTSHGV